MDKESFTRMLNFGPKMNHVSGMFKLDYIADK